MPAREAGCFTIEDYLGFSNASPGSKAIYRIKLRRLEEWGGKAMGEWSLDEVKKARAKLTGMKSGAQYALTARMFFSAAWKLTRDSRYIILVEAMEMEAPRQKRLRPDDILGPSEVRALMEARAKLPRRSPYEWWIQARDVALLGTMWDTGCRVSEALALRVGDVKGPKVERRGKETTKVYVVWFEEVKEDGQEHLGYIVDTAPALEEWLRTHPWRVDPKAYLFPTGSGKAMLRSQALGMVKRCAKKAGIKKRVFNHLLRHSKCTHLLKLGLNDVDIAKLIGWADTQMLRRYGHLRPDDAYRAYAKALGFAGSEEVSKAMQFGPLVVEPAVPPVPVTSGPPGVSLPARTGEAIEVLQAQLAALARKVEGLQAMAREEDEELDEAAHRLVEAEAKAGGT